MSQPPYPYDEMSEHGIPWHTTFIGQPMQHNFWLYCIVDRVILENPQIKSIVEIGTGAGALTSVFGLWGVKRGIPVLTIDQTMRHDRKILDRLGVEYMQADERGDEVQKRILEVTNNEPTWLYCDGGCKRDEFKKFAPMMRSGSIVSAHDLGTEFRVEVDVGDLVPNCVDPYRPEWWTELNIQLALFKRV